MLGRHADAFFRKQARERISGAAPNSRSTSLQYHDRGERGTNKVVRTNGRYEMPGPQTAVSANAVAQGAAANGDPASNPRDMLPGMGEIRSNPRDMLPGMGQMAPVSNPKDMLPGMGVYSNPKDMLPGMGFVDQIPGGWLTVGGGAAAIYFLFFHGNSGSTSQRRRRRRRTA